MQILSIISRDLEKGSTKYRLVQFLDYLSSKGIETRFIKSTAITASDVETAGQFDCVLPTRIARHGAVFTHQGRLNLRNARFATDKEPIETDCHCYTCRTFSRAYLRHLIVANEILALRLTTLHNLHFMLETMRRIRQSIFDGTFVEYKNAFLAAYQPVPEEKRKKRG